MRVSSGSSGSTVVAHPTPRRSCSTSCIGRGRLGPARNDLARLQALDPMENYLAERGGHRRTFIEDLEGSRWRELYTYLDDQVAVNAHLEGGQSVREVDLHENIRAIAGAGPGPRNGRRGGAGRDEPEGAGRAGGGRPRGVAAVGEPQREAAARAAATGGVSREECVSLSIVARKAVF